MTKEQFITEVLKPKITNAQYIGRENYLYKYVKSGPNHRVNVYHRNMQTRSFKSIPSWVFEADTKELLVERIKIECKS